MNQGGGKNMKKKDKPPAGSTRLKSHNKIGVAEEHSITDNERPQSISSIKLEDKKSPRSSKGNALLTPHAEEKDGDPRSPKSAGTSTDDSKQKLEDLKQNLQSHQHQIEAKKRILDEKKIKLKSLKDRYGAEESAQNGENSRGPQEIALEYKSLIKLYGKDSNKDANKEKRADNLMSFLKECLVRTNNERDRRIGRICRLLNNLPVPETQSKPKAKHRETKSEPKISPSLEVAIKQYLLENTVEMDYVKELSPDSNLKERNSQMAEACIKLAWQMSLQTPAISLEDTPSGGPEMKQGALVIVGSAERTFDTTPTKPISQTDSKELNKSKPPLPVKETKPDEKKKPADDQKPVKAKDKAKTPRGQGSKAQPRSGKAKNDKKGANKSNNSQKPGEKLHTMQQEIKDTQNSLGSLLKEEEELDRGISDIQADIEKEITKFAAEMNAKVSANESSLENIAIQNRPMNVAGEYQMFCSQEWLEAKIDLDATKIGLDGTPLDEQKRCGLLCGVLQDAEAKAKQMYEEMMKRVKDCLTSQENPAELPDELVVIMGDYLRSNASHINLDLLVQEVRNEMLKPTAGTKNCIDTENVVTYCKSASRLAWKMVLQRPPMTFRTTDSRKWSECNQQELELAWSSAPQESDAMLLYYINPSLYHGSKLMVKGKVFVGRMKESRKAESTVFQQEPDQCCCIL